MTSATVELSATQNCSTPLPTDQLVALRPPAGPTLNRPRHWWTLTRKSWRVFGLVVASPRVCDCSYGYSVPPQILAK